MDRFDFYNVVKQGTIRERVVNFMENDPYLTNFRGDAWYRMEDALCYFIEQNDELIFRFKDREYMTNDIMSYLEDSGLKIPNNEVLERFQEEYEDILGDSDLEADSRAQAWEHAYENITNEDPSCICEKEEKE
jgi:hypothetical protein